MNAMQQAQRFELDYYSQPANEAGLYHMPDRRGFFALCWSSQSGRRLAAKAMDVKRRQLAEAAANDDGIEIRQQFGSRDMRMGFRQRTFTLDEMPTVLGNLSDHIELEPGDSSETTSIWLSQGEFSRPNRQKINLVRIAVCWVDLDLQHENSPPHLRSMSRQYALDAVLERCQVRGIPLPTLILWTGRGLVVKWLTETLPKQAYPRWAAVQAGLVGIFADLGADASARDASRVLRLAGTHNHKSGQVCEPIWVNSYFGYAARTNLDVLCEAVLPFTREELEQLRKSREAAKHEKAHRLQHRLLSLDGRKQSNNLTVFNPIRLAWLQVDDYRKLAAIHPPATRPEGWTDSIVWLAASALAVAVWADAELVSLAMELAPHWTPARIAQSVSSVESRMAQMARGDWTEYRGKKRPPVYTPRHSTIIDKLGITDADSAQLTVILTKEVAVERERARDSERRRAMGKSRRDDYLAGKQRKRQQAKVLRAQGFAWSIIALQLEYPSADAARKACAS